MANFVRFTGNAHQEVLVIPRHVTAIIPRNGDATIVMRGGNGLDVNESVAEAEEAISEALGH